MTEGKQQGRGSERGEDAPAGSQANGGEQLGRVPGRRRFLGGATATGFVAFTVFGRPAWANGCSLSAQMSGNTSAQADSEPCGGEGLSPGFWRTHTDLWHSKYPTNMRFVDAFGVDAFPGKTLYDVISLQSSGNSFESSTSSGSSDDGADGLLGKTLHDGMSMQRSRDEDSGSSFESNTSSGSSDDQTSWSKEQDRYDKALRILGMHAVAALQNAASTLRYDLTVSEVQDSVRRSCNSYNADSVEMTKNSLDRLNNQGGSLT